MSTENRRRSNEAKGRLSGPFQAGAEESDGAQPRLKRRKGEKRSLYTGTGTRRLNKWEKKAWKRIVDKRNN